MYQHCIYIICGRNSFLGRGHSYRRSSAMAWRLAQRAGAQAPTKAAANATNNAMPRVSQAMVNWIVQPKDCLLITLINTTDKAMPTTIPTHAPNPAK